MDGDPSSTGGQIQPGPLMMEVNGGYAALVGFPVSCPACNRIGYIAPTANLRAEVMGRQFAVEGDLVICGCPRHPTLIASLRNRSFAEKGGALALSDAIALAGALAGVSAKSDAAENIGQSPGRNQHDERIVAIDQHGTVIRDYPYLIEMADGRQLFGCTDDAGKAPRIYAPAGDTYTVYWGDEALAKHSEGKDA